MVYCAKLDWPWNLHWQLEALIKTWRPVKTGQISWALNDELCRRPIEFGVGSLRLETPTWPPFHLWWNPSRCLLIGLFRGRPARNRTAPVRSTARRRGDAAASRGRAFIHTMQLSPRATLPPLVRVAIHWRSHYCSYANIILQTARLLTKLIWNYAKKIIEYILLSIESLNNEK